MVAGLKCACSDLSHNALHFTSAIKLDCLATMCDTYISSQHSLHISQAVLQCTLFRSHIVISHFVNFPPCQLFPFGGPIWWELTLLQNPLYDTMITTVTYVPVA